MRTTPEETERNNQLIIHTAIKVFAEKGYEATNMQDIAEKAKITRGPLYYRYKTKLDLFHAAVKAYVDKEVLEYERIFSQDKHILSLIHEDLYYCTRGIRTEVDSPVITVPDIPELNAPYQLMQDMAKKVYDIKIASVLKAIAKGEIKQGTDPKEIVDMMFVLYEGLFAVTQRIRFITSVEETNKAIESLIFLFKMKYATDRSDILPEG